MDDNGFEDWARGHAINSPGRNPVAEIEVGELAAYAFDSEIDTWNHATVEVCATHVGLINRYRKTYVQQPDHTLRAGYKVVEVIGLPERSA